MAVPPPLLRSKPQQLLLLADDDELSREVLELIAAEAGFAVQTFASGDALLLHLKSTPKQPDVILSDMQMPGTSGATLARQLRTLFVGTTPRLLAMSGSPVSASATAAFDGFLLKPFSAADLVVALNAASAGATLPSSQPTPTHPVLNDITYAGLLRSVPAPQLGQLYQLSLTDALKRLQIMREACAGDDDATYRSAAHAIKGGCGMVGAMELAHLASQMEHDGLNADHKLDATRDAAARLDNFAIAIERLRRMLYEKDLEVHAEQAGLSRPAGTPFRRTP